MCLLDGVYEDNIRSNETFNKVEAVSFPDYNNDGFTTSTLREELKNITSVSVPYSMG